MHVPLDSYSTVTYHPITPPPSATPNDDHDDDHDDNHDRDNHDDVGLCSAVDYPRQPVEWLWPGKIPIGKVTLLIGDPGLGKSLVALDVAARVTQGSAFPDEQRAEGGRGKAEGNAADSDLSPSTLPLHPSPGSVIILSAEDGIADTIRPRLDAHGADPSRVFFLPTLSDLRHDLGKLEAALKRLPDCRLIVVDPVNAYVGASDSHFHTIVRKVLEPLAELAAKRSVAILAVTHLRKNDGAAIYRASGSMGFVAAARTVWTICRDKSDPRRILLLPVKNNLGPLGAGLAYSIDSHPELVAPLVRWQSRPVTVTVEEAFRPRTFLRGPEAHERQEAGDWLRTILAAGPQRAVDVLIKGIDLGFSERTLRRALHAIGGETEKDGFDGGWSWSPGTTSPGTTNSARVDLSDTPAPEPGVETWPLRENPEKNGGADHLDTEPPLPPSIAASIQFLNRLDAERNGGQTARVSREPAADKDPNSPTGHPLLDTFLAEFRRQSQPRPEASESNSESKVDNQQLTTGHGPPTRNATKKVPGAIPVFVREPTPDTSLAQRTLADPERSIAATFPPT